MANESNLKPWPPGQSGNPSGKPKGTLNLSTLIQNRLNDPSLELTLKNKKKFKGRATEAMIDALAIKAIDGDVRAFEALAKYGYGNKVDITSENRMLPTPILANMHLGAVDYIK